MASQLRCANNLETPRFGWDTARRFVQSYALVVGGAPSEQIAELSDPHYLGPHDGAEPRCLSALRCSQSASCRGSRRRISDSGRPIRANLRGSARRIHLVELRTRRHLPSDRRHRRPSRYGGHRASNDVRQPRRPVWYWGCLHTRSIYWSARESSATSSSELRAKTSWRVHTQRSRSATWVRSGPRSQRSSTRRASVLERDLDDMADIEFTVEEGKLWLLQVRVGKRSPTATLRIAIDMAEDDDFTIDRAGAVDRCAEVLEDPPVRNASGCGHRRCRGLGHKALQHRPDAPLVNSAPTSTTPCSGRRGANRSF